MRVGYVHDARMEEHAAIGDDDHPERPDRHAVIVQAMQRSGLQARCVKVSSRFAFEDEYLLLHAPTYASTIEKTSTGGRQYRTKVVKQFEYDVYVNKQTWPSALLSLGSSLECAASVLAKKYDHSVACVRPPGHHACSRKAMGFCFLNNVATCAKLACEGKLVADRGDAMAERALAPIEKVLIVDIDIHHGNGTQALTYDDPRILYFSVHRGFESKSKCAKALFYPGTGKPSETSVDGSNVNVRWSEPGMGDEEYAEVWRRLLMPIAREFQPQLILVSAGFDAAIGDPLGECNVSPAGYQAMIKPLAQLAPVSLILEGGYNLDAISRCFCACVECLLAPGDEDSMRTSNKHGCVQSSALNDINETILEHTRYWSCLKTEDAGCVVESLDLKSIDLKPQSPPSLPVRKYAASSVGESVFMPREEESFDSLKRDVEQDDEEEHRRGAAAACLQDLCAALPEHLETVTAAKIGEKPARSQDQLGGSEEKN